jgi:hypothetical protein
MNAPRLASILFAALTLGAGAGSAHAQTQEDMSFGGMTRIERMDTNKDGMVSKAEFLAAMGKVWDMKAKEMKVKGGKMSSTEFSDLSAFLSRGEKTK